MGKHQNAAGIRVGLDLDGALQSDPRLVEGGLCNGQRPFQSQPCRVRPCSFKSAGVMYSATLALPIGWIVITGLLCKNQSDR